MQSFYLYECLLHSRTIFLKKQLHFFLKTAYNIQIFWQVSFLKKNYLPITICIIFLYLLFFPSQSLEASKSGLLLWFDTLLPTLLPFLIISQLLLKSPILENIQKLFGPFFTKLFHCSSDGAFCILCGFLCGYPVGARLIALQIKEHRLSVPEGQYLLAFCNNVSPIFCISYGILYTIGSVPVFPYLCIIYGSAVFYGLITRPSSTKNFIDHTKKQTPSAKNTFQLIDVCIIDSFLIMIKLCGYLILFSIICSASFLFFQDVPILKLLLASTLEITGGLSLIKTVTNDILRTALALYSLIFGGFCCLFQTNSVLLDTGLSLKKYILSKLHITMIGLYFFFLWKFFCWIF